MGIYRDQANILIDLFSSSQIINGIILAERMSIGLKTLKKEIDNMNITKTKKEGTPSFCCGKE